jgi:hypothetical protein
MHPVNRSLDGFNRARPPYNGGTEPVSIYDGGVPLALRRDTSNGPDWKDVSRTMDALEEEWGKPVEILIYHSGTARQAELQLVARLMDLQSESGGVQHWASKRQSMRSGDAGDIPAALLSLLYGLDYEASARKEREATETA